MANDRSPEFWKQYSKGRPLVPDSFFESIFKYHRSHDAKFDLLHEPGAGAGIHTSRLASPFKNVIISDPGQENLDFAKERLGSDSKIVFKAQKVEDRLSEDGQVDMVVCLNMLHIPDIREALTAIHRQLRPGGTFVYGFFAWPSFPENPNAQDVLQQMCKRGIAWLRDSQGRDLKSLTTIASDGDVIPTDGFRYIERHRINHFPGFSWRKAIVPDGPGVSSWPEPNPNEVRNDEDKGWYFTMNMDDLRENLASHPWGGDKAGNLLDDLWLKMEEAMGGKKITAVWPVSLVLATKA